MADFFLAICIKTTDKKISISMKNKNDVFAKDIIKVK